MTPRRSWRSLGHRGLWRTTAAALWLVALLDATAAVSDFTAQSDAQVLETLPPRLRQAAAPEAAALAAQRWIELSRQTSDPRYLGRAQAVLAPWWGRSDAPVQLSILQATVEQSRHAFADARKTLQQALQRDPAQAQGWLTLATLERVAGRYAEASAACRQVGTAAPLHAAACALETASLQGRFDEARSGLTDWQRRTSDLPTQAWLLSLLAESEERAGRDQAAARAYRASLALAADGYTTLAFADFLLRTGQPSQALQLLAEQPQSDAVLLRRAYAARRLGQTDWQRQAQVLVERFAALNARGDDPASHARETALAALWLLDDQAMAWQAAQRNLQLQKEPLDWWLALRAAELASPTDGLPRMRQALAASGLQDARLAAWQRRRTP